MVNRFEFKWEGGKPAGNLQERKNDYVVRFQHISKYFSLAKYGSKEKAYEQAVKFRYEESLEKGILRNRYRIIIDFDNDNDVYLEVELQEKADGTRFIMKCDVEDRDIVEKVTWSAIKNRNVFYAAHSGRAKSDMDAERFHRLLYPEFEVIDHINGDGLDNRRLNLRDGSAGLNNINQKLRLDNTTGVTGVHYREQRGFGSFVCQYIDENGDRQNKTFSVLKHGGYEQAKQIAIDFRKEQNEKTGNTNGERVI